MTKPRLPFRLPRSSPSRRDGIHRVFESRVMQQRRAVVVPGVEVRAQLREHRDGFHVVPLRREGHGRVPARDPRLRRLRVDLGGCRQTWRINLEDISC